MDQILSQIERAADAANLDELKEYVRASHPGIKLHRRSSLQSITDALLAEFYQTYTQKQIKLHTPRIREILNAQSGHAVNYLSKRFQKIRKILAERFGDTSPIYKWHKRHGGLTYDQHGDKEMMATIERDNRLANKTAVDEKDIREILNKTSASDNVFDNIIALQIATGARFIEAVRVSGFRKVPYSSTRVKIVGIAKRGDTGLQQEIDRPIFGMKIDELLELAQSVRRELQKSYPQIDQLSNEEVNKLLLNRVNSRIKNLGIAGVKSSHDMRKIFTAITHAELPNRKSMDKHLHIKTVLGHKRLETAGNYANVRINKTARDESIEQKFQQVDQVNARQDVEIKELQSQAGQPVDGAQTYLPPEIELQNVFGKKVKIYDNVQGTHGQARVRCLNLMAQMARQSVLITENILKTAFNLGSKTIASCKSEKRRFNEQIKRQMKTV